MIERGRISRIQYFSTGDGDGIRTTVFMQGCNLRCAWCHNPETQPLDTAILNYSEDKRVLSGEDITADELFKRILKDEVFYIESGGGVTFSGGEPLLQADFVRELFTMCHEKGIHTCLDTSGCILNERVHRLLDVTDRVLLDIKYTDENSYSEYVGCSMDKPLKFLDELEKRQIPTWIRQVIIPQKSDDEDNILRLRKIAQEHSCVDKIELLPFRKICQMKYDKLGIEFPFGNIPEPTKEKMEQLNRLLIKE